MPSVKQSHIKLIPHTLSHSHSHPYTLTKSFSHTHTHPQSHSAHTHTHSHTRAYTLITYKCILISQTLSLSKVYVNPRKKIRLHQLFLRFFLRSRSKFIQVLLMSTGSRSWTWSWWRFNEAPSEVNTNPRWKIGRFRHLTFCHDKRNRLCPGPVRQSTSWWSLLRL